MSIAEINRLSVRSKHMVIVCGVIRKVSELMDFAGKWVSLNVASNDAPGPEYANRLLTLEEHGNMIELLLEEEAALKITEDNMGMQICVGPVESVGVENIVEKVL